MISRAKMRHFGKTVKIGQNQSKSVKIVKNGGFGSLFGTEAGWEMPEID